MSAPCLLVADIGGTNARFALAETGQPGFRQTLELDCSGFGDFGQAIEHYLEQVHAGAPDIICVAAAGPPISGAIRLTNNPWSIDEAELQKHFGARQVELLNDFAAIAYALPLLQHSDVQHLGSAAGATARQRRQAMGKTDFTVAVLGPGTGLGIGGLMSRDGQLMPISGEGGWRGFAPETDLQLSLLQALRSRHPRIADEQLISGPGLQNLYLGVCLLRKERPQTLDAAAIFKAATVDGDEAAVQTVDLFFEILGQIAGNLILEIGAVDGVYIAGGMAKRYPDLLQNSRFRQGLENKGRHRRLLENVPSWLITHPNPGLLGAAFRAHQAFHTHD